MLRQIPNDKDGPHYELLPADGLNKSLVFVPMANQAQNELTNAKFYWNPEDGTSEPMYGTLMKAKGQLPRIELFNNQIDREHKLLQKYAAVKNKEAVLNLARTLLIKSYDELIQSIKPQQQGKNILQIYNEEMLKKVANDKHLNPTQLQNHVRIETVRSALQIQNPNDQSDISDNKISTRHQNSLPMIELPSNTESNRHFPQYMLAKAKEIMPPIRNHVIQTQKIPVRESTLELHKTDPTVSENQKSQLRIELLQTQTKLPVDLHKDLKNIINDDNQPIGNKLKITKTNIPLKENLIRIHIPDEKLLQKSNHKDEAGGAKNKIIIPQFGESSLPNKSINFESNNEPTNQIHISNNSVSETKHFRRAQDSEEESKSNRSLKPTIIRRNVLKSQNMDSNLIREGSQEHQFMLVDVVHVKDPEEDMIAKEKSSEHYELLKNYLHSTDSKQTDEENVKKTQTYTKPHGAMLQINDDSKLCRLNGGKVICDVPMVPTILKKPSPDALLSKQQINVNNENESNVIFKLITKHKPEGHLVKVKKVRTSVLR